MRRLFEQLTRTLRQFVKQRDDLLLLVACGDSESALLLKALRDLDRASSSAMFLLFGGIYSAPSSFVSDIAGHLQQEHAFANETADDKQKLPPLPAKLFDQKNSAWDRLETAICYGHSLVDPRQGQRMVWAMAPENIADVGSYLELIAKLPPRPEILPWMRGTRLVIRVPAEFELAKSPLAGADRVSVHHFVIPPDAHEQELQAMLANSKTPWADRMQAEVQLAYLDTAHGRFQSANERFRRALAYFQWVGIPAMEGLIISGMGDVARRQDDWKQAKHWYSCAVVPAAEAGNPVLLANIVQNLAVVAYQEGEYVEAEQRYSELITLKRSMFDEDGLAEALEWQGICQEKQDAYERAVVSWEEAALISKSFELVHRLDPMLAHLKRGYEHLGLDEELEEFDAEWRS